MRFTRHLLASAAMAAFMAGSFSAPAGAQGVTTGAIGGKVTDEQGGGIAGVQISAVNRSNGYSSTVTSRADGRYLVPNLEVGTYDVTFRRIGFDPIRRRDQLVSLSQVLPLDVQLTAAATELSGVTIIAATTTETFTPTNTSVKTIVTDTTLQRLPSLSRNIIDMVRVSPQVSTSGAGYSAGGMSNRMNNVQIDGATERDVFGLGATGTPGAETNSRSVSLEAVKELQILLAPFDVRQGNFGGLLVNAVTKGGSNELHGSVYGYYRDQDYGANVTQLRSTPFDRAQYGFSLGGPIIKDKLHFFVAPEWQDENTPVGGTYLGQPAELTPVFPIKSEDLTRFEQLTSAKGMSDIGTVGYANIPNPLLNLFARVDYRINDTHRSVIRYNYSEGERLRQQNDRNSSRAVYSGNFHTFDTWKIAPVFQLFSVFSGGSSNELFIGYNRARNRRTPESPYPQITVSGLTTTTGGTNGAIIAGADQFSQGNELDTDTYELTNNFNFQRGNHTITLGTRNEYVDLRNLFNQSSYGVWSFRGLDSLEAGNANSFRRAFILRDGGNVFFRALQSAWYAQDQWQVSPNFAMTLGLRADVSKFLDDVPYSAPIDSAYGRRTDDIPKAALQISPRVGFNWDLKGDQTQQIRGGIGLFVGTPPYVWLENAYVNSGSIITFLNCGTGGTRAPTFNIDVEANPTCSGGAGSKPIGDVNWLSSSLKFPQPLRASLSYDRALPRDLVFSVEGLFSKTLNQLFFVNRNLAGITGRDVHGRVLFADSIRASNAASFPRLPASVIANGGTARFSTAIDLLNQNKDQAWSLTTSLRKRYSNNWEGTIAYTHARARDVQSFGSSTHISNWQFGRTLSGDQFTPFRGISLFDQTHKITGTGTYTKHWTEGWATDFTATYSGVSGSPHDYVYASTSFSNGDMNGDGRNGNDLIYIPRSAFNTQEIRFRAVTNGATVAQQQAAFEQYILDSPCLRDQRGRILARNSCKQPFLNQVDVAIRQTVPSVRGQRLSLQADITNFGNLLSKNWGQARVTEASSNSNVPILTHVGMSSSNPTVAIPIVQFNVNQKEYIVGNFASNFWRFQLSARYSF
ncbi:MAG TPA: carboxypeptidase regulatory-like domain-containing protein [Gemmatimonadaceae bacterium]